MTVVIAAIAINLLPLEWSGPLVVGLSWLTACARINKRRGRAAFPLNDWLQGSCDPGMPSPQSIQYTGLASYPPDRLAHDLRIIRGQHSGEFPRHLLAGSVHAGPAGTSKANGERRRDVRHRV